MIYDIAIIGGGINGLGIARDAAGRGFKVYLCEQNDFASGTSSYSSKLIHGGLRYLEQLDFKLVRHALQEQERLLNIAPHLIKPLEFVMPYNPQMRNPWLIRCGLFIYDHLAKRPHLPKSKQVNLVKSQAGKALKKDFKLGFSYYDCFTDDARLAITNAKSAYALDAHLQNYSVCVNIKHAEQTWQLSIKDQFTEMIKTIEAKILINAAGPWANQITELANLKTQHGHVKLVKGSHIITKKLYDGEQAYILQNDDKRIVFVIPYQNDFSLIGTTDMNYEGDPSQAHIENTEIEYLIDSVNLYFANSITKADIVHHYSGVRALQDTHSSNPSALSRDYKIEWLTSNNLPFINILGGKITTYRMLAEQVTNKICQHFSNNHGPWTAKTPLPGGEISSFDTNTYQNKYSWLDSNVLTRLIKQYGNSINDVLADCHDMKDLGLHFGFGLYEKEINYLCKHEWARTIEDILWRRSKLGLYFSENQIKKLKEFIKNNLNFLNS